MSYKPPSSNRYCLVCQKYTIWQLDNNIGHSRCKDCRSTSLMAVSSRKNAKKHWNRSKRISNRNMSEQTINPGKLESCFKYLAFSERNYWAWLY